MSTMYRQGDVLLIELTEMPEGVEPEVTDSRGVVLAEGETSGHFHAVVGRGEAKLFRYKDSVRTARVLVLTESAEMRVIGGGSGGVDRHTPVTLPPGKFVVRVQRRWDSSRSLRVGD